MYNAMADGKQRRSANKVASAVEDLVHRRLMIEGLTGPYPVFDRFLALIDDSQMRRNTDLLDLAAV
jgi:hypothetical protein